jgi:hypothetical protein
MPKTTRWLVEDTPRSESANTKSSVQSSMEEHPPESSTPINQTLLQCYEATIDQNTVHHGSEHLTLIRKLRWSSL